MMKGKKEARKRTRERLERVFFSLSSKLPVISGLKNKTSTFFVVTPRVPSFLPSLHHRHRLLRLLRSSLTASIASGSRRLQ